MHRPRLSPRVVLAALLLLPYGCGGGGGKAATLAASTAAANPTPSLTTAGVASATSSPLASTAAATPAPAPTTRWWSGDFHVHTSFSGDAVDSVTQSANLARLMGLDFVAFTDHGTLDQRRDPGFVSTPDLSLVAGYEWTDMAHMGLIGVQTTHPGLAGPPADWPAQVQALVDDAHAEGGAAILYHPTWNTFPWLFDVRRFDAIEVWNNLWTLSDVGLHPSKPRDVQQRLNDKGLAAAGVGASPEILGAVNALGGGNDKAVAYWEAMLERGDRVAATGGSDRHKVLPPGYPTTWVLAPSCDEAHVVAAVRAGRTIVTRSPAGPRVTFEADGDGDGVYEATIGDTLQAGRPAVLRARIVGADRGRVRIVRRRHIVLEAALGSGDVVVTLPVTPAPGDWFRVDVDDRVDWSLPAAAPILQATGGSLSSGGVQALLTVYGVTLATGTAWPAVKLDDGLLRMTSVRLAELDWARAAITSPIYAR